MTHPIINTIKISDDEYVLCCKNTPYLTNIARLNGNVLNIVILENSQSIDSGNTARAYTMLKCGDPTIRCFYLYNFCVDKKFTDIFVIK